MSLGGGASPGSRRREDRFVAVSLLRGSWCASASLAIALIHDGAQLSLWERESTMATYLAFHEVDDVDHRLSSPKREEVFGPLGITARTFRDPQGSKRVGMIVEIPDFAAFQEFMQTEPAA